MNLLHQPLLVEIDRDISSSGIQTRTHARTHARAEIDQSYRKNYKVIVILLIQP